MVFDIRIMNGSYVPSLCENSKYWHWRRNISHKQLKIITILFPTLHFQAETSKNK